MLASDGREAVETFRRDKPNAVLMDVGMPGMNGLDAIKTIRAEETRAGESRTYIAAVTGWGSDTDCKAAMEAGADIYLLKPVPVERILSVLSGVPRHSEKPVSAH